MVHERKHDPARHSTALASSIAEQSEVAKSCFSGRHLRLDAADNRVSRRIEPDGPQDIAIEALEAVGAVEEAVERRGHAHRHDDPGRATRQEFRLGACGAFVDREAGPHHLLEERLQQRGHVEVSGGNYRMIVAFPFDLQIAFVKFIGTHTNYGRVDALTVSQY